jgi:hypothetical protein
MKQLVQKYIPSILNTGNAWDDLRTKTAALEF